MAYRPFDRGVAELIFVKLISEFFHPLPGEVCKI